MRLLKAAAGLLAVAVMLLVPAQPALAAGDGNIDVAITSYSPNVHSITVKFTVANKSASKFALVAHLPGERGKQRTLFKSGTTGQDAVEDSVDVPCGKAQVILFDYEGDGKKGSVSVTSAAQNCLPDVNRYTQKTAAPAAPPVAAPDPTPSGKLAKTGESGLWWAIRVGPLLLLAGVVLCIAGRRRPVQH